MAIKKSEIDVIKSREHYFLERSFDSLEQLIAHLRQYPILNKQKVISEIRRLDRLR